MNLMELYLEYEQKWQEGDFGVCDCPQEIDDDHPYPCEHAPTDEIFTEWINEQESRFHSLLQMMTIID